MLSLYPRTVEAQLAHVVDDLRVIEPPEHGSDLPLAQLLFDLVLLRPWHLPPPSWEAHVLPQDPLFGTLQELLPLVIWGPHVGAPSARPLGTLSALGLGGFPKLDEVRCLQMGLERRLVLVHLVEPDAVGIIRVLNDIKPEASGLVVHGAPGILHHGLDKGSLVTLLHLYGRDDDVHMPVLLRDGAKITPRFAFIEGVPSSSTVAGAF